MKGKTKLKPLPITENNFWRVLLNLEFDWYLILALAKYINTKALISNLHFQTYVLQYVSNTTILISK